MRQLPTTTLQNQRLLFRIAFFVLFVIAPPLDIFRFDLTLRHFILFGQPWTLGLDPFLHGETGIGHAAWNLFWRGFVPLFGGGALFLWVARRWGRLYCGWLCPHFSVVELINGMLRRATGSLTLWERRTPLPQTLPDGRRIIPHPLWWLPTLIGVLLFAFLWTISLLTYLLPPVEVWGNLFAGTSTRNQTVFLIVGTIVFTIEFMFARHLFCRFGCAVGLFQSLAWMGNKRGMVVGFDGARAAACTHCDSACDNACPMRLKPRTIKRKMFTCTQCARCISACDQVRADDPKGALLQWVDGDCALPVSDRESGRNRRFGEGCFSDRDTPAASKTDDNMQHLQTARQEA